MTGTETVAERLRNAEGLCEAQGLCGILLYVVKGEKHCPPTESCAECKKDIIKTLASQIKAEQAEPQLPEGIEWPRFEDSELVKFGDEYVAYTGEVRTVEGVSFRSGETFVNGISRDKPMKRPEPEVLDADGVPIKVGDTVYHEDEGECVVERIYRQNGDTLLDLNICGSILNMANVKPAEVTHRKPDTQEAINHDAALLVSESFFDQRRDEFEDRVFDLLKRQRKLLGGE